MSCPDKWFTHATWGASDVSAYTFGSVTERVRAVNNEIYFVSVVDGQSIEALIKQINDVRATLATQSSSTLSKAERKSIVLYIDSPGGSLKDCFKFIDFVDIMKKTHDLRFVTVCTGMVASAATLMALVGDERYITENAICMIHELFGMSIGTYTHLSAGMKRLSMYHEKLVNLYCRHNSKLDRNTVNEMLRRETWFDANEYIEHGFVQAMYPPCTSV